jgi:hypothetical protein
MADTTPAAQRLVDHASDLFLGFVAVDRQLADLVRGLQHIILYGRRSADTHATVSSIDRLSALVQQSAPLLCELIGGLVPKDHVHYSLGCSAALLSAVDPVRRETLCEFVTMFQAECLVIVMCNRILRRADPAMVSMLQHRTDQARHPTVSFDVH